MSTANADIVSTADFQAAADFLLEWPTDKVNVTCIHPKRYWIKNGVRGGFMIEGRSFAKDQRDAIVAYIKAKNADGFNVYYSVNNPSRDLGRGHPKATKDEIASVVALHVDGDCPSDAKPGDEMEAAKAEQVARANAYHYPPSIILDSGGGTPMYWLLGAAVEVTPENLDQIEARNLKLAIDMERPDGTYNIDRIMRVPCTINWPNKAKHRRGRVPVVAGVLFDAPMATYDIEEFAGAEHVVKVRETRERESAPLGDIGEVDVPNEIDIERIADEEMRSLIVNGAPAGSDRSAWVYKAACMMRQFSGRLVTSSTLT